MSNPITYNEFFRAFVLRKKQELVNPRFFGIGEIILPKGSLIHFIPKTQGETGPSNSEPFINNFPKEAYIDFVQEVPKFDMGHGRLEVIDIKKTISNYRASHYQYSWTRDIGTVYNKENVLVVKNYGLATNRLVYRPSIYLGYEKYYNLYTLIMTTANEEATKATRKQYMRIELPLNIPSFTNLTEDYLKFVSSFENGLPTLAPAMLRSTKAEGSYWLLDVLAFLLGQYEFSLFNKLTPKAMSDFHVIFTFQSKALVLNLGMLKEWLDDVNPKAMNTELNPRQTFEVIKSSPRMNAVKRLYLALMGLSRDLVSEKEIVKEEVNHDTTEGSETKGPNPTPNDKVAEGAKGKETQGSKDNDRKTGSVAGKDAPNGASAVPSSILDVFTSPEASDGRLPETQGESGTGGDHPSVEEWASQVDDTLLEVEEVSTDIVTSGNVFNSPEDGVRLALEERARNGVLTVAEQDFFMRKATRYKHIEMENGQTFEEFIQIDPAELKNLDGRIHGNFITVLDESMLRSRSTALKTQYAEKFLQKDTARMFLGIQNAGFAMNDFKHTTHTSVEGAYHIYSVQYHEPNGEQFTIHPRTVMVKPDGTFMIDGVRLHAQQQRREKPFRKISPFKVALTSYYDRKLMVTRSQKAVDNLSDFMVKQIVQQSKLKGYTFSKGNVFTNKYVPPRIYSLLAKQYKYIKVGDLTLDFQVDGLLEKYPQFKQYTKKDRFLIGVKDNQPLVIDDYGNLYQGSSEIGTVEDLLGVNLKKAPLEHAVINISGFLFPLGVVLCFYFGIDQLLKQIKATTRSLPIGTRPKLASDEYAIQFNDEYLVFNRREKLTTLIFGGMPKLNNIGNFSRSDLNNPGIWTSLMGDPRVRPSQFQEMKNLFDLFIDPITKEALGEMGLSQEFHLLLIDAAKALETDFSRHEVEIEEQRIVGYERFAGHVYTELCRSVRSYRNKGKSRKHKLDFNPDSVIINIGTDISVQQVERVNPMHEIKDQEELTFGGDGGRNQITMLKRARTQLPSFQGVVSDANKDSSNVGYVTQMTSDAGILDFRGNIDTNNKRTPTGDGSVTMNLMYGGTHDDPKRVAFTSTQASQAVTAQNYEINTLRTGYENVLAHRTSELYSKVAKDDGVVTNVEDDCLTITYTDGAVEKYPLGLVIGEASGEYHRHHRTTDLAVGSTFKRGDVVGWDDQWFMRDPFCPGQVALKAGKMTRIVLVEDQDVYEDSIYITKDLAQGFRTPFIKISRFPVQVDYVLDMKVKIGDFVEQDAILCNIEEPHLVEGEIPTDFKEEVNKLGIKQIRSKHHGKVIAIEVVYNSTLDKMSDSLKKFIVRKDKELKRKSDIDGSGVENNAVSNAFNVNRPVIAPGKAFVMIYIEAMDASTTSDKYVLGNQMKATVGGIMDRPLKTKAGEVIDIKASFKGAFNRMVLSFRNKLVTNELGYQFTKLAIKVYRGK